jgi:SM-20-related protein
MAAIMSQESVAGDENEIRVVDAFLPPEAYNALAKFIASEPMVYGSRSNYKTDPHGHWSRRFADGDRHNLADLSHVLEEQQAVAPLNDAWKFLRDTYLTNSVLIRCYLNGYTYGTDGYFHADSSRPDEHTTILYMNDQWEPDWAGETTFLDKENDIAKSVLPRRNRAVIFPASIEHAGRSVSRKCVILRKTLIFKTRKRRSSNFEKLSTFLRKAGALNYAHKSGSLHDHLVRTYSLLDAKGFESDVCFAGGLHSIYGTNSFSHSILSPPDKTRIIEEFGERVEELVRIFSMLERPRTLDAPLDLTPEAAVVELRNGEQLKLSRAVFDDLRKIECANLVDQKSLTRHRSLNNVWSK